MCLEKDGIGKVSFLLNIILRDGLKRRSMASSGHKSTRILTRYILAQHSRGNIKSACLLPVLLSMKLALEMILLRKFIREIGTKVIEEVRFLRTTDYYLMTLAMLYRRSHLSKRDSWLLPLPPPRVVVNDG